MGRRRAQTQGSSPRRQGRRATSAYRARTQKTRPKTGAAVYPLFWKPHPNGSNIKSKFHDDMNGSGVCVSDEEEEEEKVQHVFATL